MKLEREPPPGPAPPTKPNPAPRLTAMDGSEANDAAAERDGVEEGEEEEDNDEEDTEEDPSGGRCANEGEADKDVWRGGVETVSEDEAEGDVSASEIA